MYSPVCLFTFKRYEHLYKTVSALKKNYLASQTDLYICSNAPSKSEENEVVIQIRKYLKTISGFKSVNIILNEINKGQEETFLKNITKIINQYGRVIVLEEDMVTNKNFLNYMNQALDYYACKKNINSISGYSLPMKGIEKLVDSDVYYMDRSSSWSWGTWKDRWNQIVWNLTEADLSKVNVWSFTKSGIDKYELLEKVIKGQTNAWDIKTDYYMYMRKLLTVYPKYSFMTNIGMDGSGEHCGKSNKCDPVLYAQNRIEFVFDDDICINRKIQHKFSKYFGSKKERLILKLRYLCPNMYELFYKQYKKIKGICL